MRTQTFLSVAFTAIACLSIFFASLAQAQSPAQLRQQIEVFGSLPSASQQALIGEVQRLLPPAERDRLLNQLAQQRSGPPRNTLDASRNGDSSHRMGEVDPSLLGELADPQRLGRGSTLVLRFQLDESAAAPIDQARLNEMLVRLENGNPYRLDSSGHLFLPGVPVIELGGLNADEATTRIEAEPAIRGLDVALTHLPLDPVGTDALQPFGYDLFSGLTVRWSEAPPSSGVPASYVIGPGDTVNVLLFGSQNAEYVLPVSREGVINFPQIGPINVSGLTFSELRDTISERVTEQMIGVRTSITLGELRSVRVAVLGEVERPGSYSIPGMGTITSALYASGGIKSIGSLRNVLLLRAGETVGSLDVYDLLLRGDTSGDLRVEEGDAVFVPTVGATVAVQGEVLRPAIYELRDESSLSEVLALSGGLTATADRSRIKIERVVANRGRTIHDVDLVNDSVMIRDGDAVVVDANIEQFDDVVRLAGNVVRPGMYQWRAGLTVGDLLPSSEYLKPMSDLNYVLVRRENDPNVDIEVFSVDLNAIWNGHPAANNPELLPRDSVTVFNIEVGRTHVLEPLMRELRARTPASEPTPRVSIDGTVESSGTYPLEPAMRLSDLIRAGGGLKPSAYLVDAELARYEVVDGSYRETELLLVDLAAALRGDPAANIPLQPYDHLTVKEVPRWREQQSVEVVGEVRFPGRYAIRQGERLSSVLDRAGGITDLAFPKGSVFTREELRQREAERMESLASRIELELAAEAVSDAMAGDALTTGQSLLNQLRSTQPVGRLVIDLESIVAGRASDDIVLRDGDRLFIPPVTQEVMVLGEVQYATSHLFSEGLTREDYIDLSGGVTSRADRRRMYIVRANGAVVPSEGGRWFNRKGRAEMEPGDTIIVPLNTDRLRPLTAAESITQVLYNIAIAVSVINRL